MIIPPGLFLLTYRCGRRVIHQAFSARNPYSPSYILDGGFVIGGDMHELPRHRLQALFEDRI